MTVNELFASALQYDQSLMAHTLYSGLKDGLINGDDPVSDDLYDQMDLEKGFQLHQRNFLGIHSAKLYATSIGEGKFAMFFAEDEESARKLYKKEFREECSKMHLLDHGLDMSIYDIEIKQHQTWREYRDTLTELPTFAGIFEKDWIIIRREQRARAKAESQKKKTENQRSRNDYQKAI